MKWFIILLATALPCSANECLDKLYQYGKFYNPRNIGPNEIYKQSSFPNFNGVKGEQLIFTSRMSGVNKAVTLDCPSCNPHNVLVELTLKPINLPCGIRYDTTEKELTKKLGHSFEKETDMLIYGYPPEEDIQEITLFMSRGKLKLVQWKFYFD